jgi:RimJ/RimL family protein N-acetyltransferase
MTTTITTARLVLRPLETGDAGALVRWLNNFNVSKWTARIPFPYTRAHAEDFLAICAKETPGTLRLAIVHDGALTGVISYEAAQAGGAEIGYWIAEPLWGKGLGREAARAMADHAFGTAGYDQLVASYNPGNEASRRILEGLGFVPVGEAMSYSKAAGSEKPVVRMALLRGDWEDRKGRRQ